MHLVRPIVLLLEKAIKNDLKLDIHFVNYLILKGMSHFRSTDLPE